MSLEHEMLEQNSMYQHVMQENEELSTAYQACQSANEGLRDRLHQLEQLVGEYEKLIEGIPGHGSRESLAWEIQRMELQQRAHATLQQE